MGAGLPISFGENLFFEQFIQSFILSYQAVSRVNVRSDILRLFKRKRLKLQDEFRRGTFSIALMLDV